MKKSNNLVNIDAQVLLLLVLTETVLGKKIG